MSMTKDNNKRNAVQQKLLAELQSLSEVKYKEFSEKLSPGVAMLGVRNPIVRKLAQKYLKHEDPALLLQPLPLDSVFEERFCILNSRHPSLQQGGRSSQNALI